MIPRGNHSRKSIKEWYHIINFFKYLAFFAHCQKKDFSIVIINKNETKLEFRIPCKYMIVIGRKL